MKTQSIDTHPKVEQMMIDAYRNMSAAEKLKIVEELTEMAVALTMSGVRRMHPGADEQECRLRAASRWLDPDLMRKAYGWDVRIEGY